MANSLCSRRTAAAALVVAATAASSAAAVVDSAAIAHPGLTDPAADAALVASYVAAQINQTFRNASGALQYPYQVPGGPYDQLWDWDSVFVGVASSATPAAAGAGSDTASTTTEHPITGSGLGGTPYFLGSMANFLSQVNLTNGEVPGCLTPSGASPTLYHAKPILIQGALLAARAAGGNYSFYRPFQPSMQALLSYWERPPRLDPTTGLHAWHDQLETGADNLVYSQCPSQYSPECWSESQAYTLASPDLEVLLAREHQAYALFVQAWGKEDEQAGAQQHREKNDGPNTTAATAGRADWRAEAASHLARVASIQAALDTYLWDGEAGYYCGFNLSTQVRIPARTFQVAWPVWAGMANATQIALSLSSLALPDLTTPYGIRSTSSADPRYTNANMINPYSNWRGPVWANVNAVMAYSLVGLGGPYTSQGLSIGAALLHTLAQDIRVSGTWHESYDSETGLGLAAPGFLSWNTLGAALWGNLQAGVNPFELAISA